MKKFSFYNLLPEELTAVAKRILNFFFSFVQNEPALLAAYNMIIGYYEEMDKSLSKDRKSQYTIRLMEKDVERDDNFLGFRDYIRAFSRNKDAAKKEAAKAILAIIKRYGFTIYKLPVIEQSNVTSRLIAELKQPKNLEALTLLGAVEALEQLNTANTEYETLRQEKVDVETQQEYQQVYEVFRTLGAELKSYIQFMALLNKANYKPELAEIMSSVEKEITDVTAKASARATRKSNEKPAA